MASRNPVRAIYSWAAGVPALRGALDAVRRRPWARAYARRHLGVLLGRGSTWANVDGSLRLLAEDPEQTIAFGPWPGGLDTELLYWLPFVRWAQERFAIACERLAVASGWPHLYRDLASGPGGGGGAVFSAGPVADLVERYREGGAPPRPLLKRSSHGRLAAPDDPVTEGLPERYVAVAPGATEACPAGAAGAGLLAGLRASAPLVIVDDSEPADEGVLAPLRGVPEERRAAARHALIAGSTGLVASYSGLALVGALSGVPTIALRAPGGYVVETDLDHASRVTSALCCTLSVVHASGLEAFAAALSV